MPGALGTRLQIRLPAFPRRSARLKLICRDRKVELLLLPHQLSVLRRSVKKPKLKPADRMMLTALAMRLPTTGMGRVAGAAGDGAGLASGTCPQEVGCVRAQAWSRSTSDL